MIRPILSTAAMLMALTVPAFAEGDADKGEKVFKKCKACHAVGEDAKNKVGPVLNGIVGSPAGANPDFKYSDAMTEMAAEGLVWDEESLTAFLTKPKDFMKGTKMSFAGLRKEADTENVIAYLSTFN
ncbi:c-type cytochrome [Sedimentitalea todarodis]|uniref:Cytochrome c family protein n=1 Tax=Sedimentitalea todarodis TaxID=1631240 RepID=A0ABU3VHY2_9RHOB|nr:cytochrome c family protein [Sedimentitalea todarodis]MDU9005794.1 cytochrome c family protein [Sedimentitalea todarodis]